MGTLIVVEGLDGSGKATQAKLLRDAFLARGKEVMQVTFPQYDSPSSSLVRMYLAGEFGEKPEDVNPYAASSFYCVDRYASFKTLWGSFYEQGGIVIADRYTTSNAVHQCSKLPANEWDGFLSWLFDFEYRKVQIPEPDLVLYLDVAVEVSQKLMTQRYHGDESRKDIHEKDLAYLEHSRAAAQYCADTLGWKRIACCKNGVMRTIESIHSDVLACVDKHLPNLISTTEAERHAES